LPRIAEILQRVRTTVVIEFESDLLGRE